MSRSFITAGLICAVMLVFCAPTVRADESHEVKVGIFPMPPLNFIDDQGTAQGLFPDLLREIVKEEGWQLTFYPGSWRECYERVQSGEIDIFTTVAYSPERAKVFDYNQVPVADIWGRVYAKPEARVTQITDLAGRRVAIAKRDINGQNFVKTAEKFGVVPDIVELETHFDIFTAIQQGDVIAGVVPQHFGFREADKFKVIPTTIEFEPFSVYFAATKERHNDLLRHIDQHLSAWKQQQGSVYYQRVSYWMGGQDDSSWRIPDWVILTGLAIFATAIVLGAATYYLKQQVRQQTKEIAEREARFRHLSESTRAVPWEVDLASMTFTYIGPQVVEMFGYPVSFWVDFAAWQSVVHPEERELASNYCQQMTLAGQDHEFVYRTVCKDGSIRWVKDIVSVVKEEGVPVTLVGFLVDISEQKHAEELLAQSEQKYRTLFDVAAHGAAVADADTGIIVSCNRKLAEMVGRKIEEIVGKHQRILHPENVPDGEFSEAFRTHLEKPPRHMLEGQLLRKDGTTVAVEIMASRFTLADRNLIQEFFYDITERKHLLEDYRRSAQLAALGTVAAGVAHEINNPVQGIINYATLIGNAPDKTERVADLAQRIVYEGDRVAQITRDLLHYSRDNRGEHVATDLCELIVAATSLISFKVKQEGIEFQLELPDRPIIMKVHPQGIQQVLINLLDNACDALREKGNHSNRTVKIGAYLDDDASRTNFVLEVTDFGTGIPPALLSRVRDAFFTTKQEKKGTGLGLSIVGDIVAKHRGELIIESEEGLFTRVMVKLPVT